MTDNGVLFIVLAILLVAGSLAVVAVPDPGRIAPALCACTVVTAALALLGGEPLLAGLVLPGAGLVGAAPALLARCGVAAAVPEPDRGMSRWWPAGPAAGVGLAAVLTWAAVASRSDLRGGVTTDGFAWTLVHNFAVPGVGVLVVLATAVMAARTLGRVDAEEARHDRGRQERLAREERGRRRREDRARGRGGSPGAET